MASLRKLRFYGLFLILIAAFLSVWAIIDLVVQSYIKVAYALAVQDVAPGAALVLAITSVCLTFYFVRVIRKVYQSDWDITICKHGISVHAGKHAQVWTAGKVLIAIAFLLGLCMLFWLYGYVYMLITI